MLIICRSDTGRIQAEEAPNGSFGRVEWRGKDCALFPGTNLDFLTLKGRGYYLTL